MPEQRVVLVTIPGVQIEWPKSKGRTVEQPLTEFETFKSRQRGRKNPPRRPLNSNKLGFLPTSLRRFYLSIADPFGAFKPSSLIMSRSSEQVIAILALIGIPYASWGPIFLETPRNPDKERPQALNRQSKY